MVSNADIGRALGIYAGQVMNRRTLFIRSAGVVILGLVIALSFSFSIRAPRNIKFVLPDGFIGVIKVIEDEAGIDTYGNRELVLLVPTSGIVYVRSFEVFKNYTRTAEYRNGGTILMDSPDTAIGDGEIAFRSLGTFRGTANPREAIVYLIGNAKDAHRYRYRPW